MRNDDSLGVFTYHWRQLGDSDTPGNTAIDFEDNVSPESFDINENTCPTNVFETRNSSLAQIESEFSEMQNYRDQYETLIDGGNTDALIQDLDQASSADENATFQMMMELSPYLSQEVMLALIQREDLLSTNHLTLILTANTSSAKSMAIRLALDAREAQLSDDQRSMIDQGRLLISEKEQLESRIAYHHRRYKGILDRERVKIMEDTSITDKGRALEEIMGDYENVGHRYFRIEFSIRSGHLEEARALLDSISSDFELLGTEPQEYQDYRYCFGLLIDEEEVPEGATDILMQIAERSASRASGLAQSILHTSADMHFVEPVVLPHLGDEEAIEEGVNIENPAVLKYSISPNPASEKLNLKSIVIHDSKNISLEVRDTSGKLLIEQKVLGYNGISSIEVPVLSSGIYLLIIRDLNSFESESHWINIQE